MNEQSFKKYKFNQPDPSDTGPFNLPEMLGLSEDFAKMVQKTIQHEMIDQENFSIVIESVMNKILPNNTVEALWLGFALARSYEVAKAKHMHQALLEALKGNR